MGGVFLNFFFLFHLSYIIQQTLSSYTAPLYIIFSLGIGGKDCGCRFHIELWPHTGPEKDILSQQTSSYNNDKKRDLVKGWMQFHFFKINSVFFFVPVMSTKGGMKHYWCSANWKKKRTPKTLVASTRRTGLLHDGRMDVVVERPTLQSGPYDPHQQVVGHKNIYKNLILCCWGRAASDFHYYYTIRFNVPFYGWMAR